MHRLFFILISLITTNVLATDVVNLYQSYLPVATQTEEERQKVAPDILRQVLLKVVGDHAALDAVNVTMILDQADKMIHQYQYRQVNKISDDVTEPEHLEILLSFNEASLNRALTTVGLPRWGKSRPEVLVWLAVDDGSERKILSTDDVDSTLAKSLSKAADMRGLPILMPLMDLQDQSQVMFADLWAGFSESITEASKRYGTPVILMIRTTITPDGNMQIRWQALIDGQTEQWQSKGDVNTAMQVGVNELTDRLARRFSQVVRTNQSTTNFTLQISDVRDYSDYSRVLNYLTKLQYVSNVELSSLLMDTLDVTLSLKGNLAIFNRTLAIDRVLVESGSAGSTQIMHYRLLP